MEPARLSRHLLVKLCRPLRTFSIAGQPINRATRFLHAITSTTKTLYDIDFRRRGHSSRHHYPSKHLRTNSSLLFELRQKFEMLQNEAPFPIIISTLKSFSAFDFHYTHINSHSNGIHSQLVRPMHVWIMYEPLPTANHNVLLLYLLRTFF